MDEYLLKARLEDAIRLSYKETKYIGFLDPAQGIFLKSLCKNRKDINVYFWGGHEDGERLMLAVGDMADIKEYFPFEAITINFRKEDKLNHRDFLGALMSQGVIRSSVGDILVEEGRAVIFVKTELSQYFINGITKIGKVGVKCSQGYSLPLPQQYRFQELSGVVASERLDCIVAQLMKTSREKACTAISAGIVVVNYKEINSRTYKLQENDKISIKGCGKFIVETLGPPTKKDRLLIRYKKYI